MAEKVDLYGRIFVRGNIKAITGLHIGGSPATLAIGGVDNPVIRDTLTGRPYIPGSSVRGKMRSLWEKMTGVPQNWAIGRGVSIHVCEKRSDYEQCPVCKILFQDLSVSCRARNNYGHEEPWRKMPTVDAEKDESQVAEVLKAQNRQVLLEWLREQIKFEDYQPTKT